MVDNAVATFADHILIGEHVGGHLELPESVPVPPSQMRHLRSPDQGVIHRPALHTAAAATALRVHDPMALPDFNVDLLLLDRALLLQSRRQQGLPLDGRRRGGVGFRERVPEDLAERPGGRRTKRGVDADLLDFLGDDRDGSGRNGAGGWGGRTVPGGEPEGDEEEEEDEGGADADADDDPHVEAEDGGALGKLVVEERRAAEARHGPG